MSQFPNPLQPPSVLILTKNEEQNIEACLRLLSFTDDIVVLDSLSNDRTVELARGFENVRIHQRRFDIEYKQRNFGLHDITFKHPWVYICDADERVGPELAQEMIQVVNAPPQVGESVAYRVRYKNMYLGKWIKHASSYPVWIIRLVRPEHVAYEVRETNVHPVVDGPIGELKSHFVHYSFNSGLTHWLHKHNFYSTREAIEGIKVRQMGLSVLRALRGGGPMQRRRALKNLSYFLSLRALWRFLHSYLVRGGCLDGAAGFHYCILISMYEYWIELKMREREGKWRQKSDRMVQRLLAEPSS